MHLYLAYLTTDKADEKSKIYFELLQFTGTNYDSGIQELALLKLISLELFTEDVLKSLAYGTGNHRWQFVNFCKENIRKLIKDDQYRKMFTELETKLPIREKTQLQRLLNEKEIK
jgi:aminopeptidase N